MALVPVRRHSRNLSSALKSNPNPLTPYRRKFRSVGEYGVELSEGSGMETPLFGVSIAKEDPESRFGFKIQEGGKSFVDIAQAESYFQEQVGALKKRRPKKKVSLTFDVAPHHSSPEKQAVRERGFEEGLM